MAARPSRLPGDDTETGWTAGAGVEFAFDRRWSVKLACRGIDRGNERTCSLAFAHLAPTLEIGLSPPARPG